MLTRLAALLLACLLAVPGLAQAPQRQAQPQPGPQFSITNDGEVTLHELYVARGGQGARGWGNDRLGAEVVPPGESFRVRLPSGFGCVVDLRIVFESGEEEVRERLDVCRTREVAFARSLPAAADREVVVENAAPRPIARLFISGSDERDWGPDRLGSGALRPGARVAVTVPDQGCAHDVRVVFDNGGAEERRRVDLCAVTALVVSPGWTTADDPGAVPAGGEVRIVNRSGQVVFELFVFPDGAAGRGPDRLGTDTLDDGAAVRVPAFSPPACSGTVALAYQDGQREQRSGIDLCATAEIVIAPGWMGADRPGADRPGAEQAAGPRAASPGTVGILNRSGRVVFELYTFPDGAADAGPDRLGADVMRDGGTVRVPSARAPRCATTVRLTYDDGEREERSGLDFCGLTDLVIAPGWTTAAVAGTARIVNGGPVPIIALYADPAGSPRGPDRLGDGVIGRGQGFSLAPPRDGICAYDLTAVFRDRRTARIAGADLCAGAEIRMAP